MQALTLPARVIIGFFLAASLLFVTAGAGLLGLARVEAAVAEGLQDAAEHPERAEAAQGRIASAIQAARMLLLSMAVVGCALCTTLGVLLARVVGQPLHLARRRLEELVAGEAPSVPLPSPHPDARGDMAGILRALNRLTEARQALEKGAP